MIVERKQYGCITLLFVQIGLALFVIVLFFAQAADGTIKPTVLKVQKVAVARQAEFKQLLEQKYQALASGTDSHLYGELQDTAIDPETRIQVENTVADAFVTHIEESQYAKTQLALISGSNSGKNKNGNVASIIGSQTELSVIGSDASDFFGDHFIYLSTASENPLETLGSKPRAPSLV